MKLYYHASACSLAVHLVLIEADQPYHLVSVDGEKRTSDGREFLDINPKGYVPALELDDGSVLTENVAILDFIAERKPELLPEGSMGRIRALESLVYMSSEIHGSMKPLFNPGTDEREKAKARETLERRFTILTNQLGVSDFLFGDRMSIADAYLFWAVMWARRFDVKISNELEAFFQRFQNRGSVKRMLTEEGFEL